MSCARCGEQVGDTLGSSYTNPRAVIVHHDCDTCKTNYAKMGFMDKFLAPYPFKKEK